MTLTQPILPLAQYRLDFRSASSRNPLFPGSAWRGALGHHLRQIACLTQARTCKGCALLHDCAYTWLFETPVPPNAVKMRRYEQAPHPFVLREERDGDGTVSLYLTLFGRANTWLSLMVLALTRAAAGERGIGGRRMTLTQIHQWHGETQDWTRIDGDRGSLSPEPATVLLIPPLPSGELSLRLHTPLRVKRAGRHVGPAQFRFSDLFGNLLRRISMLTAFHTDTPLETDFRALTEAARGIESETDLHWVDLPRHSARQDADMALGGVVGTLRVRADAIESFWPYLWLGQYTHAGSAATMGLGHYRLTSASLPRSS